MEIVKTQFHGKDFSIETGRMAKQAAGSVVVRSGDTMVLVTAAISDKPKEGMDFFPMTVDFLEKYYAAGKMPGGFFKREAKPSVKATLTARLTDRPLRPLFPEGFRNAVQIVITTLSYDGKVSPDVLGMTGASAALSISKIPFAGPIAAVTVGLIDDKFVINPTVEELENSDLELAIAGTKKAIMMVEAGAKEIPEDKLLKALDFGHKELQKLIKLQEDLVKKVGVPKMAVELDTVDPEFEKKIEAMMTKDVKDAFATKGKQQRYDALDAAKTKLMDNMKRELGEEDFAKKEKHIKRVFEGIEYDEMRKLILNENRRVDGRKFDEIRPLASETSILPCVHGSGLFTRGETQALATVTLGTKDDEQMIDGLDDTYKKRFYLHYNFPPYSVGEAGRLGFTSRRELGHGALAERALAPLLPPIEKFPYTVRIVSEILESNGSSSMASVCCGSLALMDAGVPVKAPVAGIAMGLVSDGKKHAVLTDIMGLEDHLGDMDFKVTGTRDGITALQMDIKIEGVTEKIMAEALKEANKARMALLDHMQKTLDAPRAELSKYAPRIEMIQVNPEKIGAVIGPGGKMIKSIIEEFGVSINIDDDGIVNIASTDSEAMEGAKKKVLSIVAEAEVGKTYDGKVTKLMNFGAFVEILPGKEGLVHISQISEKRVNNVEDVLKVGQAVRVKVKEIDNLHRVNLTMKGVE
ncbi:polyribonucleotide nucleotidyltransferase [Candidatus Margulisiibacteriota bacterium]